MTRATLTEELKAQLEEQVIPYLKGEDTSAASAIYSNLRKVATVEQMSEFDTVITNRAFDKETATPTNEELLKLANLIIG